MMEQAVFPIVITGHVDHGKSTLIGRITIDAGRASGANGAFPPIDLAHVMDHFAEERERGITIDTAQKFFQTPLRRYAIIDAPGHREFMKNMLSGATLAEATVLIVDAAEGIQEQTRRHAYALSLIGVRQVLVLINKMDLVQWSEERFLELARQVEKIWGGLGIAPLYVLPAAAATGENISRRSEHLSWYKGPTLLEALDQLVMHKAGEMSLRFAVQDFYSFPPSGPYLVGRVEAGVLRPGMSVTALPGGEVDIIKSVEKFGVPPLAAAGPDECVALKTDGAARFKRGDLLVAGSMPKVSKEVAGRMIWLHPIAAHEGGRYLFCFLGREVGCTLGSIRNMFDPAAMDAIFPESGTLYESHVADILFILDAPLAFDPFCEIHRTGRFVIKSGQQTMGAGTLF